MTKLAPIFKILTALALLVVLVMSLRPSVNIGAPANFDKIMHLIAYAGLAGLARIGWPKLWGGTLFLILAAFGIGIEISQHLMALGRTGSIGDVVANLLGTALPLIFFHIIWTRHKR